MMLDLTNEETDALARLLSRTIDDDRYPLSPRIQILKGILVKIGPEPPREPLPTPRHYEPPRATPLPGCGERRRGPTRRLCREFSRRRYHRLFRLAAR